MRSFFFCFYYLGIIWWGLLEYELGSCVMFCFCLWMRGIVFVIRCLRCVCWLVRMSACRSGL